MGFHKHNNVTVKQNRDATIFFATRPCLIDSFR